MNFYLFRIYFFLIICGFLYAQEEKIVSEVGDYKIYESEFNERFDFSAHPKLLQDRDTLAVKHKFLEQLIAEKLLSLDAIEKGYGASEIFTGIIIPLENMFVRDALYNLEIKDKVSYSDDEINEGIQRIKKILKIKFFYSKDRDELQKIYHQLESGVSFDSLLSLRTEAKVQPMEITFGKMNKTTEDSVYKLKEGEFTNPIEFIDSYYLFKLINVEQNPGLKEKGTTLDEVKKILEARAENKRYFDYFHNFFSKYKVTADREVFEELIKIFIPKFISKYSGSTEILKKKPESDKYYLTGSEVTSALQLLDSSVRDKIFIDLNENPLKVKYFLNQLSYEGFIVRDTSEISIRLSLSSYIRKFIEDELLAAEGNRKGLNNSYDVKKYLGMWKDSYLSKLLMLNMFDSIKVTEEEAYSMYKANDMKNISLQLVNIAEVLTDSLAVVESVLNELSHGKNIKDLAKQYTKRDSLKDKGGEFGFFPVTMHGEIGRIASQMKVGDIYGPIKLDEGYSVFQLIDRKEDTTGYSKNYDEVIEQLISQLTLLKFEKFVNEYNARLAQKYGVKIYEDVLKETDNIFINSVVVRYMGFGGEIFAVPYTEQFSGWYDIWQQNKEMAQ